MTVFFSFFSPLLNAHTRGYQETQAVLNQVTPDHRVLFPGSPFSVMPHPLLRAQTEIIERRHILRLLADHWNELAEARDRKLVPAFANRNLVMLDGCGCDAAFSLWHIAQSDRLREEIVTTHFQFVRDYLKAMGIPAPMYVIVRDSNENEYYRFRQLFPDSHITYGEYICYLDDFDMFLELYFQHPSQHQPFFVEEVSCGSAIAEQVVAFLQEQPMELAA